MTESGIEIPLFPLSTVVLPGGLLPLRIFEKRYVDMVGQCMRKNEGFGVTTFVSGSEVGDAAVPAQIGTLAKIIDFDQGNDGLLHILARGERKFRLLASTTRPDQLIMGEVVWLDAEADVPLPGEYHDLRLLLQQVIEHVGKPWDINEIDINSAAQTGARLTELLPLPPALKQQLMEIDDPIRRIEKISSLIERSEQTPSD